MQCSQYRQSHACTHALGDRLSSTPETINAQAKVSGDHTVLFKSLNPHLIAVATESEIPGKGKIGTQLSCQYMCPPVTVCHLCVTGCVTCVACVLQVVSHVSLVCCRLCHMCHLCVTGCVTCVTCVLQVVLQVV